MQSSIKSLRVAFLAMVLLGFTSARATTFTLNNSTATTVSGNTTSLFYGVTGAGVESGTAASLYSTTLGGNANDGYWALISFGSNPQPVLTSAFVKASNKYLYWDATDLTSFNAGIYDSIKIFQNGLKNQNNKFHEISHLGLNGSPGTAIPDGGSTLALLGASLAGVSYLRHRKNG